MKLIIAIAALALVANSVDVDAQKRKGGGRGKTETQPKQAPLVGGPDGEGHAVSFAPIAASLFNELAGDEKADLVEDAQNGDEEALEELRTAEITALEAAIDALDDEGSSPSFS